MKYSQKHYINQPKQAPFPGWKPDGFERIQRLTRANEAHFSNQRLRRGPDGCPFPFHEPELPSDWTWWTCWRMFDERLFRLREWCKRLWDLVDTTETIFIECIWQILDISITNGLFELPISIYKRHPLRFAVAHRQHGMQLRSAWTNPHPASIQDRDPSKDNMSIEACIVDYAKSNYLPAFYPLMKRIWWKIFDQLQNGTILLHTGRPTDNGTMRELTMPDVHVCCTGRGF